RARAAGRGGREAVPCAARSPQWSSHGHEPVKVSETLLADAGHLEQFVDDGEAPVLVSPVEDALGQRLPDARQRLELLNRGGVEIRRDAGCVSGGRIAAVVRRWLRWWRRWLPGRRFTRHHALLTVGEHPGEIDRRDIGFVGG